MEEWKKVAPFVTTFELKEAIRLLFFWQYSNCQSFHDFIYLLFQKADAGNLAKLKKGFPAEFVAWQLWLYSGDQDKFFKKWGFDRANIKQEEIGHGLSGENKSSV